VYGGQLQACVRAGGAGHQEVQDGAQEADLRNLSSTVDQSQ